mmetsp:Transcript_20814/g.31292  ORF Transcript_20814/g.31292 Transcript_20814/m.31292 type:complete len:383 (-) Transcript_20814:690-1838(-)
MSAKSLPPVVFIHGWKASVLVDKKTGKDEFSYTLGVVTGMAKDPKIELPMEWDSDGNQVKDNLIATEACHSATCMCGVVKLGDIYGPVLDHLEKTRDLNVFAYDWRFCLDETAANFTKFLINVKETTGQAPQVVAHSMGCLITLHVLNHNPHIFHSILFGAGAIAPNAAVTKDYSLLGEKNTIIRNKTMFTPKINLTNPSALHFIAYTGERELYSSPNTVLFRDGADDDAPIDLDLHNIRTWKQYKIGIYHPESGVDVVTKKMESWFQSVLDKAYNFRLGLLPQNTGLKASDCPPIAVLRGDHCDTEFSYTVRRSPKSGSYLDLEEGIGHLRGDGRVTLEDTVPPVDIPICKIVTNSREHSEVLNDLENVDMLINLLISEKK